jgi:hypothetical protein
MIDLRGLAPESWRCVDCNINTAPGLFGRAKLEQAFKADELAATPNGGVDQSITQHSEVYIVRGSVWKASGMEPWGGCLCIGCLEKRIGRRLKPKDFPRHPFNRVPVGTRRLLSRRDGA